MSTTLGDDAEVVQVVQDVQDVQVVLYVGTLVHPNRQALQICGLVHRGSAVANLHEHASNARPQRSSV